jgi:hypothetical protein
MMFVGSFQSSGDHFTIFDCIIITIGWIAVAARYIWVVVVNIKHSRVRRSILVPKHEESMEMVASIAVQFPSHDAFCSQSAKMFNHAPRVEVSALGVSE